MKIPYAAVVWVVGVLGGCPSSLDEDMTVAVSNAVPPVFSFGDVSSSLRVFRCDPNAGCGAPPNTFHEKNRVNCDGSEALPPGAQLSWCVASHLCREGCDPALPSPVTYGQVPGAALPDGGPVTTVPAADPLLPGRHMVEVVRWTAWGTIDVHVGVTRFVVDADGGVAVEP
jgi:hypothetical protein